MTGGEVDGGDPPVKTGGEVDPGDPPEMTAGDVHGTPPVRGPVPNHSAPPPEKFTSNVSIKPWIELPDWPLRWASPFGVKTPPVH
jgi:hypothetical protein